MKTQTYTIDTNAPVTTASPAGGTYSTAQLVTLTCNDGTGAGCDKIYYTTDGNPFFEVQNDARTYVMGIGGWNNDCWFLWDETAAAPRITVTTEGNVGIYSTAPGNYRLYVNGTTYSVGGYQISDVDYKENIGLIESPLSKILAMEGVSFSWRKDEETKDKGFPEGRHYGVIAQVVEKVLPEIVKEGPKGEKAVAYTEIIPILIEAIKEQQKEIIKLKGDLEALKK